MVVEIKLYKYFFQYLIDTLDIEISDNSSGMSEYNFKSFLVRYTCRKEVSEYTKNEFYHVKVKIVDVLACLDYKIDFDRSLVNPDTFGVNQLSHKDLLNNTEFFGPDNDFETPEDSSSRNYILDLFYLLDRIENQREVIDKENHFDHFKRLEHVSTQSDKFEEISESMADDFKGIVTADELMDLYSKFYASVNLLNNKKHPD